MIVILVNSGAPNNDVVRIRCDNLTRFLELFISSNFGLHTEVEDNIYYLFNFGGHRPNAYICIRMPNSTSEDEIKPNLARCVDIVTGVFTMNRGANKTWQEVV